MPSYHKLLKKKMNIKIRFRIKKLILLILKLINNNKIIIKIKKWQIKKIREHKY